MAVVILLVAGGGVLAPSPRLVDGPEMVTETISIPSPVSGPQAEVGAGHAAQVVSRDAEPFVLLGIGVPDGFDGDVHVRVRSSGVWSSWRHLPLVAGHAPDAGEAGRPGLRTEPMWVGSADGFEVEVDGPLPSVEVHLVRHSGQRVSISEAAADAAPASPTIRSRSSWGARPPKATPFAAADFRMGIVHHSATGNSYSSSEVPAILRSIQAYHMDANGWDDIGYNFAVDRFGRIWEARAGGVGRAVVGGHSFGFNTYNTGVVVLGDFTTTAIPSAALSSVAEVLAWKFAVHGVSPTGSVPYTTVVDGPRYAAGTYEMPRIAGHRDVGVTGCPGDQLYRHMAWIRARVVERYPAYLAGRGGSGHVGDFDGDLRADHLYYQPGSATDRLRYGRANGVFHSSIGMDGSYRVVTGDFDGDGRDDVFAHGPGSYPDHLFRGRSTGFVRSSHPIRGSYKPFVGDFDGDGFDDIFWYGPGQGADSVGYGGVNGDLTVVGVSNGTTYTPTVGDFDGDGLDDVLWYRSGSTRELIWYGRSDRRFSSDNLPDIDETVRIAAGDFDGDGRDDLLLHAAGTASDRLLLAGPTRAVFTEATAAMPTDADAVAGRFDAGATTDVFWYGEGDLEDVLWRFNSDGSHSSRSEWLAGTGYRLFDGDFNGDGIDDLLLYKPGVSAYLWFFRPDGTRSQVRA